MDRLHLDGHIGRLRDAALRFGAEMGMLERATCDHDGCTRPGCPDASMETVTLRRILGVLAEEWNPDDLPAGPAVPRRIQGFREALMEFGDALGFFACECADEWCPKREPHALTPLDLLAVVAGEWHARAGCMFRCQHPIAAEHVAHVQATLERNRARVNDFRARLETVQGGEWEAMAESAERIARTLTYREARVAANHCIDVWVAERDEASHPRAISGEHGWDATLVRAVADACDALLVRDLLAPEMFDALYAPAESVVPTRWIGLN